MKYALTITCILLCAAAASGQQPGTRMQKSGTTTAQDNFMYFYTEDFSTWIANNGTHSHNPLTDASGFEWPLGSAKHLLFNEGLLICGRVDGQVRVSGTTYRAGWQAGNILPNGFASNPMDPRHRVYMAKAMDAAQYARLSATEQQLLRQDFEQWPVDLGAPFHDHNGDGRYTPSFNNWLSGSQATDAPLSHGTCESWYVANDLDAQRTSRVYGSQPMGLEIQFHAWADDVNPAFENTLFMEYTVINKGRNAVEDVYLARWVDPDLGDAFDDFVGVDTSLSMMYCYNGKPSDDIYGANPPAIGIVALQNPIVPSPGDVARYDEGLREGYRNLPLSAFAFYINGNSTYSDPSLGESYGATMMYNYARGLLWNGTSYIDPNTSETVRFPLAGDPVANSGWVDGILHQPGDRRMLFSSGPFSLQPGDTQRVVTATIVGQGADATGSITALRNAATAVRSAYFSDITEAGPPPFLPSAVHLAQNHPNPVHGRTLIPFSLDRSMHVVLSVYNLLGQRKVQLLDQRRSAGRHGIPVDVSGWTPGMYFYVLKTRSGVECRNMLVLGGQ